MGPDLEHFEQEFAAFAGCSHAVGVSSGTDALKLALLACGVAHGDEVVVPVNTYVATAEAVVHAGGTPVFVDCVADTANIDPSLVGNAVSGRTSAIIPVHLYGRVADMDSILEIASTHGLVVVEDACQAHGATYRGRVAGSFGTAAAFSFYPSKNLGALGDGGAVVTGDAGVAGVIMSLRDHGQAGKSVHVRVGYCDRLHNIQAAFLRAKLEYLPAWNEERRVAATYYDDLLARIDGVEVPSRSDHGRDVFHLYVIRVRERDRIRQELATAGIATGVHYPVPLHLQPAFAYLGHVHGDFPVAEGLASRSLSLPMFPGISRDQMDYVADILAGAVGR
jgi:dTDP-4-amino-4,6-dideoxygalactose transaminase